MDTTGEQGGVSGVGVQLLPWRPRWRGRDVDGLDGALDLLGMFDGGDPVSAFLGALALLLVLPLALVLLVGVALLGLELLVVLPLALVLLLGRLCWVRPWALVVRRADGRREVVRVRGLTAARRRRRELLHPGPLRA